MGGLKRLASLARGFAAKAVNGPGTPAPPGGFKHPPVPYSLEGALGAFASVPVPVPVPGPRPRPRSIDRSIDRRPTVDPPLTSHPLSLTRTQACSA